MTTKWVGAVDSRKRAGSDGEIGLMDIGKIV